eukprot:4846092-Pleurochrysis_carterae.AAC.1
MRFETELVRACKMGKWARATRHEEPSDPSFSSAGLLLQVACNDITMFRETANAQQSKWWG